MGSTLHREMLNIRVVKNMKTCHAAGAGATAAFSRDRQGSSVRLLGLNNADDRPKHFIIINNIGSPCKRRRGMDVLNHGHN